MEKIYMEESRSQRQKKRSVNGSVILSFVVAIVAVFSLAVYGIASNQATGVSYAVPVTGDDFTFYLDNSGLTGVTGYDADGNDFYVPRYYANSGSGNPIFCIEHMSPVSADGPTYVKGDTIEDYGLLYILNNSFVNGVNIIPSNTSPEVEAWATQVAIWLYLYEQDTDAQSNPNNLNFIEPDDIETIDNVVEFSWIGSSNVIVEGVPQAIHALVDAAKDAERNKEKQLTVKKTSDNVSKTKDEKYYQSSKISVIGNPSSSFEEFEISLSGIDGAFAVNSEGTVIEDPVPAGTDFYVVVPADKVTEKVQTLQITVSGKFSTLSGNTYYASSDQSLQKVVSVTGDTTIVVKGTEVEFIGAPNTGMNTAQTIYFIGLIILLCGVGIVYANAKPVESK